MTPWIIAAASALCLAIGVSILAVADRLDIERAGLILTAPFVTSILLISGLVVGPVLALSPDVWPEAWRQW